MPDRIALKRLSASDLTFFESLFRASEAGNQKAINLNADVFIDGLYPGLPALTPAMGDVIPVLLTINGPNGAGAYVISRAITKREAYKNWRLNGEFVRDPEGEEGRFNSLKVGDLALMDFTGDPRPQRLTLLLIAAESEADAQLHAALAPLVPAGRRSTVQVTRDQIAAAAARESAGHPIWQIAADPAFEAALEDAIEGGLQGSQALRARPARVVTASMLAAAKAAAERNGRDGEALAWVHLQRMKEEGEWAEITWVSKENAVSPFDFRVTDPAGVEVKIDAKSTSGDFERVIHMSIAELAEAASGHRYDIFRVYSISEDGAKVKIARDVRSIASLILAGIKMPKGVTVDSVSIDPSEFAWGPEVEIERPDETIDGV